MSEQTAAARARAPGRGTPYFVFRVVDGALHQMTQEPIPTRPGKREPAKQEEALEQALATLKENQAPRASEGSEPPSDEFFIVPAEGTRRIKRSMVIEPVVSYS